MWKYAIAAMHFSVLDSFMSFWMLEVSHVEVLATEIGKHYILGILIVGKLVVNMHQHTTVGMTRWFLY